MFIENFNLSFGDYFIYIIKLFARSNIYIFYIFVMAGPNRLKFIREPIVDKD